VFDWVCGRRKLIELSDDQQTHQNAAVGGEARIGKERWLRRLGASLRAKLTVTIRARWPNWETSYRHESLRRHPH